MTPEQQMKLIHTQAQTAAQLIASVGQDQGDVVADMARQTARCLSQGGRFLTCGNGGSAGDAQHIAGELSGKFYLRRPGLAAMALTTNSSAITAIGNDFSFDEIFSRQLEGLAHEGDILLAISTSGGSGNMVQAVIKAREIGMTVFGFTGKRGLDFAGRCDLAVVVPSEDTPRIQEAHIFAGHMLCQLVESALFEE